MTKCVNNQSEKSPELAKTHTTNTFQPFGFCFLETKIENSLPKQQQQQQQQQH
jgi:hypothetical protein